MLARHSEFRRKRSWAMDKVAVAVATPDLDAKVESRFGRAAYLLVVDPTSMTWEALENSGANSGGAAGIQAAQLLSGHGVGTVVSGRFGPNASEALNLAGIAMSTADGSLTAREALMRLQ